MAGKKHVFKIYAKDNGGCSSNHVFAVGPKTVDDVTYYAINSFPRISDFSYNISTKKFSFSVTDNAASTTVTTRDVYDSANIVSSSSSTSVSKTFSVSISKLTEKSGYYYIRITAKDKSECYCTINIKFALPETKTFKFTYYTKEEGGSTTASGLTTSNFKIDSTLGCYTYNGKVVLAGATKSCANYLGVSVKSYIHYFDISKRQTVKFVFNNKIYTGVVLDACGASCKVSSSSQPNILDMFFPTNAAAKASGINQQKLSVSIY